jgi:protein required for attachment to host cells
MNTFPNTWVVVADGSRGRFFELSSPSGPLTEVIDLVAPNVRLKEADLTSDRAGFEFDSGGTGRHAMRPESSAKQAAVVAFAREVTDALNTGFDDHRYKRLVLIAPPKFLGQLRAALAPRLSALVAHSIDRDLTRLKPEEIATRLPRLSSL